MCRSLLLKINVNSCIIIFLGLNKRDLISHLIKVILYLSVFCTLTSCSWFSWSSSPSTAWFFQLLKSVTLELRRSIILIFGNLRSLFSPWFFVFILLYLLSFGTNILFNIFIVMWDFIMLSLISSLFLLFGRLWFWLSHKCLLWS